MEEDLKECYEAIIPIIKKMAVKHKVHEAIETLNLSFYLILLTVQLELEQGRTELIEQITENLLKTGTSLKSDFLKNDKTIH